jgi:hypothetical protein
MMITMSKIKKNAIALLSSAPKTDARDGSKNSMGSNEHSLHLVVSSIEPHERGIPAALIAAGATNISSLFMSTPNEA